MECYELRDVFGVKLMQVGLVVVNLHYGLDWGWRYSQICVSLRGFPEKLN